MNFGNMLEDPAGALAGAGSSTEALPSGSIRDFTKQFNKNILSGDIRYLLIIHWLWCFLSCILFAIGWSFHCAFLFVGAGKWPILTGCDWCSFEFMVLVYILCLIQSFQTCENWAVLLGWLSQTLHFGMLSLSSRYNVTHLYSP